MRTFTDPSLVSTNSPMAVGAVGAAVTMVAVETLGDMTITKPKVSSKASKKTFEIGISIKRK